MSITLYVCYFGVLEPLVQTQVLPYLRELLRKRDGLAGGHPTAVSSVHLLTFEPSAVSRDSSELKMIKNSLEAEGIVWHSLPYHKRLSLIATAWDVLRGAVLIRKLIGKNDIAIIHGRIHIPVFMAAIARRFSRRKPKLLFDIRGFFPEEYVDAGIWKQDGFIFHLAKRVENWLLRESDGFVVLTERAKEVLFSGSSKNGTDPSGKPIHVIPCCVDFSRFSFPSLQDARVEARRRLGVGGRKVIVYVGSFGGWYLTEETICFLGRAKLNDPSVFAMILTQSNPEAVRSMLRDAGFTKEDFLLTRVPVSEVPDFVCAADIAISFIKPCYSKQASSPTKNAEYLACGIPIIANTGIGDTDELIKRNRVGALIDGFSDDQFDAAISEIEDLKQAIPDLPDQCRRVAQLEFDLESVGGRRYRGIYEELTGK